MRKEDDVGGHAFYIRTKATPCVKVWQTSNLRPLRISEKRYKDMNIQTAGQKYHDLPYSIRRPSIINQTLGNEVQITTNTRMWANAQRDGRPAEYRWRPLFNAAKFG